MTVLRNIPAAIMARALPHITFGVVVLVVSSWVDVLSPIHFLAAFLALFFSCFARSMMVCEELNF